MKKKFETIDLKKYYTNQLFSTKETFKSSSSKPDSYGVYDCVLEYDPFLFKKRLQSKEIPFDIFEKSGEFEKDCILCAGQTISIKGICAKEISILGGALFNDVNEMFYIEVDKKLDSYELSFPVFDAFIRQNRYMWLPSSKYGKLNGAGIMPTCLTNDLQYAMYRYDLKLKNPGEVTKIILPDNELLCILAITFLSIM